MKIWLPYLRTGSGTDVFTDLLRAVLADAGYEAVAAPFDRRWQYFPQRLAALAPPAGTAVTLANSWNAFAFRRRGIRLVMIEHHCVLDPAYAPYRSRAQALYHEHFIRRFERAGLRSADAVVAVSAYTARSLFRALGGPRARVILNGVDTGYFTPPERRRVAGTGRVRLLFVGNLLRRKGADLLPKILSCLGDSFELRYTSGLRPEGRFGGSNLIELGQLGRPELRHEYRQADLLLFPSRLEGFGYAPAEAMACGTPVVCTDAASLPEVVEDGVTGRVCPTDDVPALVAAVQELAANRDRLAQLGQQARARAVERFSLDRWGREYVNLIQELMAS